MMALPFHLLLGVMNAVDEDDSIEVVFPTTIEANSARAACLYCTIVCTGFAG